MDWFSISSGMIRIGSLEFPWPFGVVWVLLLIFLISGHVISAGKWMGIHIYSRKKQPAQYWWNCLFYAGIAVAFTFFWKQIWGIPR
jgi:hypothetical protein